MLLKNKKGILFGALDADSIAWKVAQKCHQEGASIVLTNTEVAQRLGKIDDLAAELNVPFFPCDVSNLEDIELLIDKSQEHFGGQIDFILHAVGMSYNIRKQKPYTNINYDFMQKTLDISAISLHKILQTCYQKNALSDAGSVVTLSYIAAQRILPNYNDMTEAKALLESIVRHFGYYYGKNNKVRINAISQSPTMTTAGKNIQGFQELYEQAEKISPLGNATAEDCANLCSLLFSDYTTKLTMQTIYLDGGFSMCL